MMVIYKLICPHRAECSVASDQKWHDPCAPPSLLTDGSQGEFFVCLFPQMKKNLKGKCFADVEEVKQKWQKY